MLSICNDHKIPVVPFGTGTSLEGNVVGNENGITISLEKMNKVLSVNVEDFDCRVQACVTREQLNDYLREDGVFFPIDPGANAAIGGMASTSASGTMAVKYGTMKTVISGLTVVLPNGDIINTGSRTKKTSAGYNLTNLFIGSEGTLGIITEVQLRLSPIPESIMSAVCHFPSLEMAVQTAQHIIQYGVPIARIEMLNKEQMEISINYSKLKDIEAVPTLFFEFHGTETSNQENIKIVEEISQENNGSSFKWAKDLAERNKLWQARWDVYYSVKALINNGRVYSTDVCLPISNITECVNFAEDQTKKLGLRAPMVGHLGDGNFHVVLPYDPKENETYDRIRKFSDLLIDKTLELNGTITGEHGVGLHKKAYLLKEHGDSIPLMKSIKRTIDRNNIMNPGKIFDLN
ncbi:MAG: 2-hydroxy-acid oxidase [Candidatus Pelagibacter sp. TMED275]|nr:MAG: 2-hydroxy-acid oxidase [Candidatus Pelagibacter sp. TMED275]